VRRFLPRLPGTSRETAYIAVEGELKDALAHEAKINNCSMSFVGNTILAHALDVKVRVNYYDYRKAARRTKKTA
jgi:hypothetical protein